MLFRMATLTRNLTRASQHVPVMARMSGHAPSHWLSDKEIDRRSLAHMDNLPVPEGSWEDSYRKNQAKYNVQLLLSIGITIGTLFGVSNLFSIIK